MTAGASTSYPLSNGLSRPLPRAEVSDFRHACRQHAAGIAVITLTGDDGPVGFTASSFAGLSAEPPLVSFNIGRTSSSLKALLSAEVARIHLLGEHEGDLAVRFSGPARGRFDSDDWSWGPYEEPRLDAGRTHLVVSPQRFIDAGDHLLVIAALAAVEDRDAASAPLVHSAGGFRKALPLD